MRTPWRRALAVGGFLSACVAFATPALSAVVDIIPRPHTVEAGGGGPVWLREGAAIATPAHDAAALSTARWLAALAKRSRGLRLTPGPENATAVVSLERRPGPKVGEAYKLDIGHGRIRVQASSDAGLLYGAVTVWQLMTVDSGRGSVRLESLHIEDEPRFVWRGLLLDSARHFQSPAFIERMIDWMALHKLNVLQWHLTDDQGWRLPVEGYTRLMEVGAWRVPASVGPPPRDPKTRRPRLYGGFYTRGEIRRIVAHARTRNVTIVPEIEMPGHAVSALLAYPRLSAGSPPPRSIQSDWGIFPYAYGVDDDVFVFLDRVLAEVTDLFPSRFIGIGGDEVPLDIWKASPKVQARMKALGIGDEAALQTYFIRRIDTFLAARGRRPIGWEEILQGGALPPDAAIASWRGAQSALAAARAGHDVVLATAPTLYFDNRQSNLASEPPGRGWVVSLQDVYALDPASPPLPPLSGPSSPASSSPPPVASAFSDADRAHILGVQGNLWSEHIRTDDRMATMMFPRAAAVAEAGWSAQSDRNWQDFLRRMPAEFGRFSRLGLAEDESIFAIEVVASPANGQAATIALSNQTGFGQIRYSLDGRPPTANSPLYLAPVRTALPARLEAASFLGLRRISRILDAQLDERSLRIRTSQQLTLCPGTLPLNLEGEGGDPGPVFLVEVMNACWIWPEVDLSNVGAVEFGMAAAPFNLQLGPELAHIVRRQATVPGGDIEVRLDTCDGELLATLPLGPATNTGSMLSASLPPREGVHALCFAIATPKLDPIWGIDHVRLIPRAMPSRVN